MTSKEKVQYNENEEVTDTYDKILERSAVRTGCLDGYQKPWYLILTLPLRIAEFITTLLLFGIVVYLSTEEESGLRNTTTIFMVTLTTSYLFFACLQIIAHFTGSNLPEYPFVFFNFLGMCFYLAAAFSILYTAPTRSWGRLASFLLSFLIGGFHTASILILLIFWRERFKAMQKCNIRGMNKIYPSTQMLYSKGSGGFDAATTCQCEMATSVSHCGVLEEVPYDAAIEAHGTRKIETCHRRLYVDKHCSCPEIAAPKAIEVQTECGKIATEETQTHLEVKEIIIQTLSKCELCNRQMIDPEPTPVTPVPSEEIPAESTSLSVILKATESTTPTLSIYTPQIPKLIDQATQSGCVMPCPNASTPTPFYIIPGGLGLRDGMNPCCGACNCGHTPTIPSQQYFCPPKEPEPKPLPPPPPTLPPQSSWTTTCETRVVEPGPCEKSSSHDRDLVVNPGDKTARIICPGGEPYTQKMHRIKIATKVGSGAQQLIDCHSSTVLIQKNKKTQTKVRTYVCPSEESSDEKDDKKACRCRRVLHVKSQIKDGRMQQINEDCEDLCKEKGHCGSEQVLAITESKMKTNKRTKPLYRESIEEKKPGYDTKSDNDRERTEKIVEKESKTFFQTESIKEISTKDIPKRFKSKISPSPSQTKTSLMSKKSEESSSKLAWQRSNKDFPGNNNLEDATVRIEDVTDDQQHSTQSPVNYLPPSQSRIIRESEIDQSIKAHDKELNEMQNEFPEEL